MKTQITDHRLLSRFSLTALGLFIVIGLTGCYTQLALVEDDGHGGVDYGEADYDYEEEGDVLVRKYYEDGYYEEDYYEGGYDWYHHQPYSYARYFDRYYGPYHSYSCFDFYTCDPTYYGYGPSYGSGWRVSVGLGWGWGGFHSSWYDPFYWRPVYNHYSHYPTYAYYGGGYYGGGYYVSGYGGSTPNCTCRLRSAVISSVSVIPYLG